MLTRYATPDDVMVFPGVCMACNGAVDVRMVPVTIPFFKEVVIMSSACDGCGYRNTDIKPGGAISAHGRSITCAVRCPADMGRDVIKSDTAEGGWRVGVGPGGRGGGDGASRLSRTLNMGRGVL